MIVRSIVIGCLLAASCATAADLPPEATVLDPDIIWDVANPQSFAISPDGKLIAYISKGAVWSAASTQVRRRS